MLEVEKDRLPNRIAALESRLSSLEAWCNSNLLDALELGQFNKNDVLDRLNNLKCMRRENEAKLNYLLRIRENLAGLSDAKLKLDHIYNCVVDNLHNCTSELKRLLFDALDLKVYASTDTVEIQGIIPLELPTTAQTSA